MDERLTSSLTRTAKAGGRARIAVLWRGDPNAPHAPAAHEARLRPVIDALDGRGHSLVRGARRNRASGGHAK
ncbi:MAG: hypothetical protein ABL996_12175 [Micropepsaceae bacterium]